MGRALACVAVAVALAADGAVDLRQSSIVATFKQQHAPVDATFKNFSGSIVYDAAKPAATVATLTVDMNSLDIGDDDTNAEVRKPAWFDSAHYPQASFRSTAVTPGADGHFEVSGTLDDQGPHADRHRDGQRSAAQPAPRPSTAALSCRARPLASAIRPGRACSTTRCACASTCWSRAPKVPRGRATRAASLRNRPSPSGSPSSSAVRP